MKKHRNRIGKQNWTADRLSIFYASVSAFEVKDYKIQKYIRYDVGKV